MFTNFVYVEVLYGGVEAGVQVVEEFNHLERRALGTQRGEADNIAEVYRHTVVSLRHHGLAQDQLARH